VGVIPQQQALAGKFWQCLAMSGNVWQCLAAKQARDFTGFAVPGAKMGQS
jgi:hypothetical protein